MRNYRRLIAKIDEFAATVTKRCGENISCRLGCDSCCVDGISVWRIERDFIVEYVSNAKISPCEIFDACRFLNNKGSCMIYDARPVVCRLWGMALLLPKGEMFETSANSVSIQSSKGECIVCPKNFSRDDATIEINNIVDWSRIILTLTTINQHYCKHLGVSADERFSLGSWFIS